MSLPFDLSFNTTIQGMIVERLRHSSQLTEINSDRELVHRASKIRILGAIGQASGLLAFPKIRELADEDLVKGCNSGVLARGRFVPLKRTNGRVLIAVANPWDFQAEDYWAAHFPDDELTRIVTLESEISAIIESIANSAGPSQAELEAVEVEEFYTEARDFNVTNQHEEPIAQLVASMIAEGIRQHASDIHIRTEKSECHYCYRIDGDLCSRSQIPLKLKDRIDAFLLTLMRLSPEERSKRVGISGRLTANYLGRSVGIRYERHRSFRGYHITLRLLDKTHIEARLGLGSLAFDQETLFELEKAMSVPSGIIVMAGPTGSGKSTTLNAMLRELNRPEENILTLENPVEDEIPGVTHCDLRDPSEFKPMITSFMRSDPDIILMGEVRDRESAELAIEAAITGHKVMTTIHSTRASQIIERFEQLGTERWKIAQTLKAACSQRLVKLLCPECRVKKEGLSDRERRLFQLSAEWNQRDLYEHNAHGCSHCAGRGYVGRTAILEILPITPRIGDMLAKGQITPYELEQAVRHDTGLPSLRENGLKLYGEGRTDLEALRRVLDLTYID